METKINGIRIAATLIGVICASAAGAQQASDETEPGAPPEQLAEIVVTPVELRAQVVQAATGPLLAQVNPPPTQSLPNTAGPLPLFALAGLISLLGGFGLTIRRRFFARK